MNPHSVHCALGDLTVSLRILPPLPLSTSHPIHPIHLQANNWPSDGAGAIFLHLPSASLLLTPLLTPLLIILLISFSTNPVCSLFSRLPLSTSGSRLHAHSEAVRYQNISPLTLPPSAPYSPYSAPPSDPSPPSPLISLSRAGH